MLFIRFLFIHSWNIKRCLVSCFWVVSTNQVSAWEQQQELQSSEIKSKFLSLDLRTLQLLEVFFFSSWAQTWQIWLFPNLHHNVVVSANFRDVNDKKITWRSFCVSVSYRWKTTEWSLCGVFCLQWSWDSPQTHELRLPLDVINGQILKV